jgi:hypothetical protein
MLHNIGGGICLFPLIVVLLSLDPWMPGDTLKACFIAFVGDIRPSRLFMTEKKSSKILVFNTPLVLNSKMVWLFPFLVFSLAVPPFSFGRSVSYSPSAIII